MQRGVALHRAGNLAAAAHCYEQVLALAPDHPDALHLLGLVRHAGRDMAGARSLVARAVAARPGNPAYLVTLGNVEKDAGNADAAIATYRRALELDPSLPAPRNNLGTVLMAAGHLDEAIACFRQVLAAQPAHVRAWFNLGEASARRHDWAGALAALRQATTLEPAFAAAWGEMGLVLLRVGQPVDAVAAFARRVALAPDAVAYADLALALHRAGSLEPACDAYERSLALAPDALEVRCNYCALLQKACDWERLARAWPPVAEAIAQGRPGVPPGLLVAQPDVTPAMQLAAARANAARWSALPPVAAAPARVRVAPARLRVGYLSADFRAHATAHLAAEVLERHDRRTHEVVLLSYGPDDGSAMRARLAATADRFVELAALPDDAAARVIAEAGIDVLVDLNGNTDNGRMGIAARRAAPLQVAWLGFPATLGAPFYDYLIADAVVVPPGAEQWYAEKVVRMPHCYQGNDRQRPRPREAGARRDHGLPAEAIVLACLNQSFKIAPAMFALWMRVLAANERAVLWLLDDNAVASARLRERAATAGVDASRLVFAPHLAQEAHLARYRLADLAIDTFPCTSHTTASDALWMGCPLVTLAGDTFASRVAASVLSAAGLAELVAASFHTYESMLLALVRDASRLRSLRDRLDASVDASPLFDTAAFTRALERAYGEMHRRHAAGEAPAAFNIA